MNTIFSMKKIRHIIMALALIASILISSSSYASKFPTPGITIDNVKMRKKASLNSVVEANLSQGSKLEILGKNGRFYYVEYNNKKGYILEDFVQLGTELPIAEANKYNVLSLGARGYEVMALQEALEELKFYSGEIDANYGANTKNAVIAFQKKNKLKPDGKAGETVQRLIYDGGAVNKFGHKIKVKTLPPIANVPMAYGSRGQAVADLQMRLKDLQYYNGEITRSFDIRTRNAVAKFQNRNGINKNLGKATPETLALLYSQIAIPNNAKIAATTPQPLPQMPNEKITTSSSKDDIKNVQSALKIYGYYDGKINGKLTTDTTNAIKDFQKINKLKDDGIAGKTTLTLLFSNSAIKKDGTKNADVAIPISTPMPQIAYPNTNNARTLKEGDYGDDVKAMQQRLSELGFYNSRNDGKFQAEDRMALMTFQQNNGLAVTGIADNATLRRLFSSSANNTISLPVLDATSPSPINIALRSGDVGENVIRLQEKLITLHYLNGVADGKYGNSTKKAVQKFQRDNKLSADGVAGAMTLSLLYSGNIASNNTTVETTQILKRGSNNLAVKEMQNALIRLGYLQGVADGKFGANTQLALINFQLRNNLKNDGIAGISTLNALNSDTAKPAPGVSPTPRPEAPPATFIPNANQVKFANWYTDIRPLSRKYPNITVYDFSTGLSWQLKIFSTGSHADAIPLTAQDTANMNKAFGNKTSWTPKPVWVAFSNGEVYMATTHNVPHGTFNSNRENNFNGHLCIHFPRTLAQVQAIGPYATNHQNAVEIGWQQTQQLK